MKKKKAKGNKLKEKSYKDDLFGIIDLDEELVQRKPKEPKSRTVSARLDIETLKAAEAQKIDIGQAFKDFVKELVGSKKCPACGQKIEHGHE
jgi:hypothetical protein